jgi:hypothetical protein
VSAPETPAEVLARAARLMRERAGGATPGPWEHETDLDVTRGYHMEGGRHVATWIANCDMEANAGHIAGMHPLVALAVATWLEDEAGRAKHLDAYADSSAYPLMVAGFRFSLAVARAYLNEAAPGASEADNGR